MNDFNQLDSEDIIKRVLSRLGQRKNRRYRTNQKELLAGIANSFWLRYAQLDIEIEDVFFLNELMSFNSGNNAVSTILEACSYDVEICILLPEDLLHIVPIAMFTKTMSTKAVSTKMTLNHLPVTLCSLNGVHIKLYDGNVLSYADVNILNQCWLLVDKNTIITALAQDVMKEKNIHLVKSIL